MNILIPESWLREYLETNANIKEISRCLSLCGPSVERVHEIEGEVVLDVEITTNRVDCMSILGIAREAIAILPRFGFKAVLKKDLQPVKKLPIQKQNPHLIAHVDHSLCHMFYAQIITGVKVAPSPTWVENKLKLIGLKPINNLVDITNLLTHELGQPMHIFDWDKLGSNFEFRLSRKGESITTLDGETRNLPGGDIVIENAQGELVDLCGIMGGKNSAVDTNTTNALLFVQTYNPNLIRKTSMNLNLRTQAATLFEKNLPVESVIPTAKKALEYIVEQKIGNLQHQPLIISKNSPTQQSIKLTEPLSNLVNRLIGVSLNESEIKAILSSLNFRYINATKVEIPWYRVEDIQIPQDLVEEIARIYGYHNLAGTLMTGSLPITRPFDTQFYWESRIKYLLKHLGCTETYTYSLVSSDPNPNALKLKNPLSSDWVYLRTSLIPSHDQVMNQNINLSKDPLTFFEIAKVYLPKQSDLPLEQLNLIISTSNPNPRYLKGILESICSELGVEQNFDPTKISHGWCSEIPLTDLIGTASNVKAYSPISHFNEIVEDYNIYLKESYSSLISKLKLLSPLIKSIELVDQYAEKITIRVHYHSVKFQISDSDIQNIREKIYQR